MNPKKATSTSSGLSPGDVFYILSRHKWLIAILVILTVAAALVVRSQCQVPYVSEAKIMIKYVIDDKAPEPGRETSAITGTTRGDSAVNSEMEVLTSADLAAAAVDVLGPARILAKVDGSTNRVEAINVVRNGLEVTANRSDVVDLYFSHPDPDMVQPILSELIVAYLKKHHEIHQGSGYSDFAQKHLEEVKGQLADLERQYQDLKQKAGIPYSTLDDGEQKYSDELDRLTNEKLDAEAKLASSQVRIAALKEALAIATGTAGGNSSNAPPVPRDKITSYRRICDQLSSAEAQQDELLGKYTPNAPEVERMAVQVSRIEGLKKQLETQFPALTNMETSAPTAAPSMDARLALREEIVDAEALAARINVLGKQLGQVQTNSAVMSSYEIRINELERQKAEKEVAFTFWSRQVEEFKVKEEVGSGTNISPVESPTAPSRDLGKFNKLIAGIMCGGLVLAFGLPFVIELYLDRTFKRPLDVKARIPLPFFISIPQLNGNGGRRALKAARKAALLNDAANGGSGAAPGGRPAAPPPNGAVTVWDHSDALQPFYETLRDRLMTYFEVINLTHKPKLVAVTSCGEGAGVTTTAAGLASSLSETGDGNVLLVNMNVRDGEAQHFYKGKLACRLDEILDKETRDSAYVQGNLYVAEGGSEDERLPRVLPKRFSHLLPKMKASDFDYIIFDMPPVNQISITPRLARFMDMVLLVIESGKTDRDVATRAAAVLSETKTNVGVVLNKNRSYGPGSQHQDI